MRRLREYGGLMPTSGPRLPGAVVLSGLGLLLVAVTGLAIGSLGIAAALLLAVPLFVLLLVNPVLGLLGLAILIPFEVAIMFGGATLTRLVGLPVAVAWIIQKLLRRESFGRVLSEPFVLASVLFFSFALASVMWAEYPVRVTSEFFRLGMLFALSILVLDLIRTWKHLNWLVQALVVGAIIAAIMMVSQYFGVGIRRTGTVTAGDPNAAAYLLVSMLPLAFYLVRAQRQGMWRLVGLGYLVLGVTAITTTFSRMAFLMIPLLVAAEYWETLKARAGRVVLVAASVVAVVLGLRFIPIEAVQDRVETIGPYIESTLSGPSSASASVSGRGYHIRVALAIFVDYPLLGVGYRNYGEYFLRYQHVVPGANKTYTGTRNAHGSHHQILAELGIMGAALWVFLFAVVYRNLRRVYRNRSVDRSSPEFQLVRAIGLVFLVQVLYGFYADIHLDKLFWLLLGLTVAVRKVLGSQPDYEPESGMVDHLPQLRGRRHLTQVRS